MISVQFITGLSKREIKSTTKKIANELDVIRVDFKDPFLLGDDEKPADLLDERWKAIAVACNLALNKPGVAFAVPYTQLNIPSPNMKMNNLMEKLDIAKDKRSKYIESHLATKMLSKYRSCPVCKSSVDVHFIVEDEKARHCPVCGKDMRSDSDKQKIESYTEKIKKIEKKYRNASNNWLKKAGARWVVAASDKRLTEPEGSENKKWCSVVVKDNMAKVYGPFSYAKAAEVTIREYFRVREDSFKEFEKEIIESFIWEDIKGKISVDGDMFDEDAYYFSIEELDDSDSCMLETKKNDIKEDISDQENEGS